MEPFTGDASLFNPGKCRGFSQLIFYIGPFSYSLYGVVNTYKHPDNKEGTSNGTHPVHRHDLCNSFKEVTIQEGSIRIKLFPHRSLGESGHVHRQCVNDNSQCTYPEM